MTTKVTSPITSKESFKECLSEGQYSDNPNKKTRSVILIGQIIRTYQKKQKSSGKRKRAVQ